MTTWPEYGVRVPQVALVPMKYPFDSRSAIKKIPLTLNSILTVQRPFFFSITSDLYLTNANTLKP